jgi:hypothetical protein
MLPGINPTRIATPRRSRQEYRRRGYVPGYFCGVRLRGYQRPRAALFLLLMVSPSDGRKTPGRALVARQDITICNITAWLPG